MTTTETIASPAPAERHKTAFCMYCKAPQVILERIDAGLMKRLDQI